MKKTTFVVVVMIGIFVVLYIINPNFPIIGKIFNKDDAETVVYEGKVTKFEIAKIGRVVTAEGYFTDVQVIDKSKKKVLFVNIPGTAAKYIYSYDGYINVGVNFDEARMDVDEKNKIITVCLPDAEIFETVVDESSLQVYLEDEGWFNDITLEDVSESRENLEANVKATAIENGILESAQKNAENVLTAFLASAYDLTEYEVVFGEI